MYPGQLLTIAIVLGILALAANILRRVGERRQQAEVQGWGVALMMFLVPLAVAVALGGIILAAVQAAQA